VRDIFSIAHIPTILNQFHIQILEQNGLSIVHLKFWAHKNDDSAKKTNRSKTHHRKFKAAMPRSCVKKKNIGG
jgi:hypothetical protein